MRINSVIRNTIIGLTSLLSSSTNQLPPKAASSFETRAAVVVEKAKSNIETKIYNHDNTFNAIIPYSLDYKPLPLNGKTIMINPGHGQTKIKNGKEKTIPGAIGKLGKKEFRECDINDSISNALAKILTARGAKVVFVDNTPVPEILIQKLHVNPDLFIANHCDSQTKASMKKHGKFTGESIYTIDDEGKKAANYIQYELKKDEAIPNNYINSGTRAQELTVLQQDLSSLEKNKQLINLNNTAKTAKHVNIPSMLIEYGYMSNKTDLAALRTKEYQTKAAEAVANGIEKYYKAQKIEQKEKELKDMPLTQKMYNILTNTNINWLKKDIEGVDR